MTPEEIEQAERINYLKARHRRIDLIQPLWERYADDKDQLSREELYQLVDALLDIAQTTALLAKESATILHRTVTDRKDPSE